MELCDQGGERASVIVYDRDSSRQFAFCTHHYSEQQGNGFTAGKIVTVLNPPASTMDWLYSL